MESDDAADRPQPPPALPVDQLRRYKHGDEEHRSKDQEIEIDDGGTSRPSLAKLAALAGESVSA